jgi:galactose-1-phosphate uridylyltransferase
VIEPLTRLPDGTIKQVNPLTGTTVWTLSGRGARPLGRAKGPARPLDPMEHDRHCAFCWHRMLETTPEIARLVRCGDDWRVLRDVGPDELSSTHPEFRRIANLFEILTYDYWHRVHGYQPTPESEARRTAYLGTPEGRAHVTTLARIRMRAKALDGADAEPLDPVDLDREAVGLFSGNHQVVIARRHFVDGATHDDQLAGSGTLTPEEHWKYVEFTVGAVRDLYRDNPAARYVAVFQNWLGPAGASFEHLHKQVVAIDELGPQLVREIDRLTTEPDVFVRWGPDYARQQGLVVAQNGSAIAFAGVGHRFPALEVHSTVEGTCPWDLTAEQLRDVSDLLHACQAATGVDVPSNEEWHHRPPSVELPMPLRIVLKWRLSTPAGFEGGTKIYVNTLDPWAVRERALSRLRRLAANDAIAEGIVLG